MQRKDLAQDMKKAGSESLNFLYSYIENNIPDKELIDKATLFLRKRKPAIARPWIVKNSYSYFNKSKNIDYLPLAAVSEIENISNYQSNAVYDNKYITTINEKEKVFQIISSFVTRNIVDDILYKNYKPVLANELSRIVRKIDMYDQYGQFIEFNRLYYSKEYQFSDIGDYLFQYITKAMYYGGAWVGGLICAGATLAGQPKNNNLLYLVRFGILSGTAMNIGNDISDYALFTGEKNKFGMHYKKPEDQFKDIENMRVLVPYFYATNRAQKNSKKDYRILTDSFGKQLDMKQKKHIFDLIQKYNGLSFAYSVAKYINNRALKELNKVSRPNAKEIQYFKILSSIVQNNKFLHHYRAQNAIKKITLDKKAKSSLKFIIKDGGIATGMASDLLKSEER